MSIAEYWQALKLQGKVGLSAGLLAIVAFLGGGLYWTMRPDYEVAIRSSSPERIAAAVREIERLKIPYRVSADGSAVEVPSGQLGRVRVGVSQGAGGAGSGVGFELFNNTDFSTTEFTQKINYQRALQGELARTISSIEGVSSARVHLVLPESGFLRRQGTKATAAVTVVTESGVQLSPPQVQGIQKLIAASVPEIRLDDIAVLDQDGVALTRTRSGTDDVAGHGRLDMQRDVDAYLEGKIRKMLMHADPEGDFSISVDATLRQDDVRVTTEDVLPADASAGAKQAGVLVRERQTQRSEAPANEPSNAASGAQSAATTREVEYKVGHRVEQVVTAPGGIERVSIAVIGHVSSTSIDALNLRDLVMHAVGASEERGDSVAVVLLPVNSHHQTKGPEQLLPSVAGQSGSVVADRHTSRTSQVVGWIVGGLLLLATLIWLMARRQPRVATSPRELSDAELEQVVTKIETWLQEAKAHGTN